jgi:hypothetical protein
MADSPHVPLQPPPSPAYRAGRAVPEAQVARTETATNDGEVTENGLDGPSEPPSMIDRLAGTRGFVRRVLFETVPVHAFTP